MHHDTNLHTALAVIISPERVLTRPIERVAYASDASLYRLIPRAVVQPVSVEEVRALFAFSHAHRIPLTFRAAGTSLSGQAVTDGILVDVSHHWKRLQIEDGGTRVRVQPGVIGGAVNAALKPYAGRIGPDPASIDVCMMGGILANNSGGMCCGVVENPYSTLAAITFMLPNGLLVDSAAPCADEQLRMEAPEIVEGLFELKRRIEADPALCDRIRTKYRMKNTTGYSLNAFLDFETPADILGHLMIGSEGSLGFIAEAVLRALPDYPLKYTGLLYFSTVQEAGRAIMPLRYSGTRTLEIMDRAALRSVENLPGAPPILTSLPEAAAALLVEYQCATLDELVHSREAAAQACRALSLLHPPTFTEDPHEQAAFWKLRKGMFPSISAMRRQGTTAIMEDLAFPLPRLAEAITDLQALFCKHDYDPAIIFGHAKDGNLHFVITPSFGDEENVRRFGQFMADMVSLVVSKYDGALKAEHGTGRNKAPFVETEWGSAAYQIMKDLKALIDPDGLLNPGVLVNPDPLAHLRHLKPLPTVEPEVDKCIECGFCEPKCPSRRLTLTPRQRIVVRREIARLRASGEDPTMLESLLADYQYAGLDTCAVDGLCATACPVSISTGDLVKRLRAEGHSPRAQKIAHSIASHFETAEAIVGAVVRLGHIAQAVMGAKGVIVLTQGAEHLLGRRLPKWNTAMPRPTRHIPPTQRESAQAVYFPSCLSRTMGTPPNPPGKPSLIETFLTIAERANVPIWIPKDSRGHCCGMPFGSKGYSQAYRETLHRMLERFWEWSEGGRLPVVIDASSCTYTLRTCTADLTPADLERWRQLTILDSLEFVHDILLPRLPICRLPEEVVLHPNCAARKLDLSGKLADIAGFCAASATTPQNLECCAFAGDRGLLFPEMTTSAAQPEAQEVNTRTYDGYYSSNLTCEMGMSLATGRPYRSFLYLVERATRTS